MAESKRVIIKLMSVNPYHLYRRFNYFQKSKLFYHKKRFRLNMYIEIINQIHIPELIQILDCLNHVK